MISFNELLDINQYAIDHALKSYERYNNRNINKKDYSQIFLDCLNGKIAEFCCYYILKSNGRNISKPDLEIHSKNIYDPDLISLDNNAHLHVKSFVSNRYIGIPDGLVFQKNDPLYKNPKDNEFIIAMEYINFTTYKILAIIPSKKAIYAELESRKPTKIALNIEDNKDYIL